MDKIVKERGGGRIGGHWLFSVLILIQTSGGWNKSIQYDMEKLWTNKVKWPISQNFQEWKTIATDES